eukprot:scaffold53898_cov42-Phaeocystis_antarctica.AAC.1
MAAGGCHPTLAELLGVRCVSKGGFLGGSCLLGQLKKKRVTSLANYSITGVSTGVIHTRPVVRSPPQGPTRNFGLRQDTRRL